MNNEKFYGQDSFLFAKLLLIIVVGCTIKIFDAGVHTLLNGLVSLFYGIAIVEKCEYLVEY